MNSFFEDISQSFFKFEKYLDKWARSLRGLSNKIYLGLFLNVKFKGLISSRYV